MPTFVRLLTPVWGALALFIHSFVARSYCIVRELGDPGIRKCLQSVLLAWGWLIGIALLFPISPGVFGGASWLGLLICVLAYSRMLSISYLNAVALYFVQVLTFLGFCGAFVIVYFILGLSTQPM